jgi:hypothetical protein
MDTKSQKIMWSYPGILARFEFPFSLRKERTREPNRNFKQLPNRLHCQIWKDLTVAIAQVGGDVVLQIL